MTRPSVLDQLYAGPAAGFEQPFELLAACHGRVERMLGLLERLAGHLAQHGADGPARSAAMDITRYFDVAGLAHHEDEERHVLPRLRASDDPALCALADRLHGDHTRMAETWAALRADLTEVREGRWPPTGVQAPAGAANGAMPASWADFAAHYRQHIAAEDELAYPAVRATLDPHTLQDMGQEMAARRGAKEIR